MGPSLYSCDALRGFEGGFGAGEQEKARNAGVARGERTADVPHRTGAGTGGSEAAGRRRADSGGTVHHRLAEREEQIPSVAAHFVPGRGGRGSGGGGGGGCRRGENGNQGVGGEGGGGGDGTRGGTAEADDGVGKI